MTAFDEGRGTGKGEFGARRANRTATDNMKILGISNHGLTVIALLIAVLWSVIFVERSLTRRAQSDYDELRRSWGYTPVENVPSPVARIPESLRVG